MTCTATEAAEIRGRAQAAEQELFYLNQIDLWEVYDECAICPACDTVVPGYECFAICPKEVVE